MKRLLEVCDLTARMHLLELRQAGPEALRCHPETAHAVRPVFFAFLSRVLEFLH